MTDATGSPSDLPLARNPTLRDATRSVSTYCRICEACCGLIAELDGDRIVRVRPNSEHAHSRGFSCNKPQGLVDLTYDAARLSTPMIRTGGPGEFSAATWDEALDLCAERLNAVRDEHGPEALAVLRGNPPFFDSGGFLWARGFAAALGITRTYTINAEDAAARMTANEALYGDVSRFGRPDLWHTDLALIIGANPLQSRSTRVSEPQSREAFDSIVARGGRVLVVDPQRTTTAERYEHISLRPGTDPWFLIGVCQQITQIAPLDELMSRGAPASGLAGLIDVVRRFDLQQCADRSGVEVQTLRDVASAFVSAESAVVYGATGTCAQRFGTLTNILQDTVLALTGNIDRLGGLLAGWAAIDLSPATPGPPSGARRSRAEGRPEVGGGLPSAALAPDILEPGPDRVRAVINHSNNGVLTSGGGEGRLATALQALDFSVGIDIFMNETNRYADVLLPTTAMFERSDYPLTTANMQLRPTAYATDAVIEPIGDARDTWWIFDELSRRMGRGSSCPDAELRAAHDAAGTAATPSELIDALLRRSPALMGVGLDDLITRHPNGIALKPSLPVGVLSRALPTPDGAVQLCSPTLVSEIARLVNYVEPDDVWPMRMVGRREKGSQNSWMHRAGRIYPDTYRFAAHVHPEDATAAGVVDGETVRLTSSAGSIEVPITIVDSIRPGVVSVPNGWGHAPAGGPWSVEHAAQGANTNILVDPDDVEAIAGMSILNGVPVRMERLGSEAGR